MWRDTVNVAVGDRVELIVQFEHFTGTTISHCHIVEHEDRGMMGQFAVVRGTKKGNAPATRVPSSSTETAARGRRVRRRQPG